MAFSKLSFLRRKQKSPTDIQASQAANPRPSLFDLPPEVRDRIFYFAFDDLRIHLMHWDDYPRASKPQDGKRPSWVPSKIECVPVLRVSKLHHAELRNALRRHATVIVYSEGVLGMIADDRTLGLAIRRICMNSMSNSPPEIYPFLFKMPNLTAITFSLRKLKPYYIRDEITSKVKPFAICKDGTCSQILGPRFLRDFCEGSIQPSARNQTSLCRYILKWRVLLDMKPRTRRINVAVELNIFIKVPDLRWDPRKARIIPGVRPGLYGIFKRYSVRRGWVKVLAKMDVDDGLLRFDVDGYYFKISQLPKKQVLGFSPLLSHPV